MGAALDTGGLDAVVLAAGAWLQFAFFIYAGIAKGTPILAPVVLAQAATAALNAKTRLLLVLAEVVGAALDTGGLGAVVLAACPVENGRLLLHGLAGRRSLGGRCDEHLAGDLNDLSSDDNKAPVDKHGGGSSSNKASVS